MAISGSGESSTESDSDGETSSQKELYRTAKAERVENIDYAYYSEEVIVKEI